MKQYQAPWGLLLRVFSTLATALLLGVAAIPGLEAGWLLLPLAILAGALPFVVRSYTLRPGTLLVRRLWWDTRIDLAGLRSARFDPAAMRGSIRTCGNGGLFSFTGWYWSRQLRSYRAFVTDPNRAVVLTFDTRRIVVSPDNPEAFVREISAGLPA
jgi:hypothetical protein